MATRTMRFDRDTGEYVYFLDDRPVTKARWDADWHIRPPDFAKGECPKVKGDLDDWSAEGSGRGRWSPQVNAWCRSPQEIEAKGRAKGFRKLG